MLAHLAEDRLDSEGPVAGSGDPNVTLGYYDELEVYAFTNITEANMDQLIKTNGAAIKTFGKIKGTFKGSVANHHIFSAIANQMFSSKLCHFSGTDKQYPFLFDTSKNLFGKFNGCITDGNS